MENDPEYTIDALIEKFEKRAMEQEKTNKEFSERWEYMNGTPFPHDKFNILCALLEMCKEIKSLKEGMMDKKT